MIPAGELPVGTTVQLNEDGKPKNYLIVNQGKPSEIYDDSCNGTWLLRENCIDKRSWDIENKNKYEISDIYSWLDSEIVKKYDKLVQESVKQVKIPYRKNGGSGGNDQTGINGILCKTFLLSGVEVGFDKEVYQYFPNDGSKLSFFEYGSGIGAARKRVSYFQDSPVNWCLRSPDISSANNVFYVQNNGFWFRGASSDEYGIRNAIVLGSDFLIEDKFVIS